MKNSYYRDVKLIKEFGANLKRLRKAKGISQEEMSNELGFSQPHIAMIENGKVNTSISHAVAFARVLKISVSCLFEFC